MSEIQLLKPCQWTRWVFVSERNVELCVISADVIATITRLQDCGKIPEVKHRFIMCNIIERIEAR